MTLVEKIKFWISVEELKSNLIRAKVPKEFWRYDIPKEYI